MNKILSVLAIIFLLASVTAHAATDAQCVDVCLKKGYESQYCQENCSDDSNPGMTQQQTIRQVDPRCMSDCTNSGHDNTYCTKACTY